MKKIFNEQHKKWIKENAIGVNNEELTEMFNKKFNMKLKVSQIKKFKNFHHISSGLKNISYKIGSERVQSDYVLIKIAEPNVWIEKHRYIYEKKYGKIPKGYKVIFADRNNRNFNLDNLLLVSNSEALILNINKLIYENPKLTKTGVIISKLIDKTNKLNRKNLKQGGKNNGYTIRR